MERTITGWASEQLDAKLAGLTLCPGVQTSSPLDNGFMSGEVTIGERKGKSYPIYSLEVEIPWSGSMDGQECSGTIHLPDISMEMLEDLELELSGPALPEGAEELVLSAVREWASELRKAVGADLESIPLDPPTESQTPRAAALISDEEAMSATGAAARDEAEDDDVEDVPHPDDQEGEGEEEPFAEDEVAQMLQEVKDALLEAYPGEEGEQQVQELEEELGKTQDLQEQGRMLMDVMDYLQNPPEEGEEGADPGEEGAEGDDPPYPGEEGLQELWKEVTELCNEEDIDRLEEELKDKKGEDQWNILLDVRDYLLNGDEEEQNAFAEWQPSPVELEQEWKQMLKRVPKEEIKDVQEDWKGASFEDKKRMVWDVRKFLEQQEEEPAPAGPGAPPKGPPPKSGPPPSVDDPEIGSSRSEVRRRGARRGAEYEYNYEYDVPGGKDNDGGEWDDYYNKEAKRSKRSGSRTLVITAGVLLLGGLVVMLTAAVVAEEDESVTRSALRLLRLA